VYARFWYVCTGSRFRKSHRRCLMWAVASHGAWALMAGRADQVLQARNARLSDCIASCLVNKWLRDGYPRRFLVFVCGSTQALISFLIFRRTLSTSQGNTLCVAAAGTIHTPVVGWFCMREKFEQFCLGGLLWAQLILSWFRRQAESDRSIEG